jgi:UDP-glucose 4-epimerase
MAVLIQGGVMARRVLVTGGAGFIGSSLVRALLDRGDQVAIIDNFATGRRQNLVGLTDRADPPVLVEGSILDGSALDQAMSGCEVVFHQAAVPSVPRSIQNPVECHEANATGTLRVLEAARRNGVRRVVYAGSSSAYGELPTLPKVETLPTLPISPYAAAKLLGEHYCRAWARCFGLETVVLRYFNVFGPRQDPLSEYAAVIPRFVTAALAGDAPVINGDGTQSRDFCYIDNVIEANLKAAEAPNVSGAVFNVACGQATSLLAVLAQLSSLTGKAIVPRHVPARAGDVKHSLADIGAARSKLGYAAAVPFSEGLRRTVEWHRGSANGSLTDHALALPPSPAR